MSRGTAIDGLPVIDAKKTMILHVTKEDLSKSNPKRPESCALAQACLKKKGVKEVRIHLSRAYVRQNDNNWVRFMVSPRLRSEIIAFDRGGKFAPGDYTLERVRPSKRLGARHSEKRLRNGRKIKNRPKRPYHVVTNVRTGPA